MTTPALLGGTPERDRPFHSSVNVGAEERAILNEVLESREFSRFMGSPTEDMDELLEMESSKAVDYKSRYFTFLGGYMVRRFEADFAAHFSTKYAITVNSATSGLSASLGALGIGPGDEVVTTCLSFNATALSILMFNSIPVFVDVLPENFCLDPQKVREAITERTKAILVVHLLGFPAPMDEIMEIARTHNLAVIEDCAQAPGTRYQGKHVGAIGHMGVFSFQETKNIMTGEGGIILTDDPKLARRARLIRNHGESIPDTNWQDADLCNLVGLNFRMTELTAALGVAQTGKLDALNHIRTENTVYLQEHLKDLPGLEVVNFPDGAVPHLAPFIYREEVTGVPRHTMLMALRAEGIPVGSGYQRLMYENPIFQKQIAYGQKNCPWSCHLYQGAIDYHKTRCPVAKDLIERKFIWFYHISAPNTVEDMKTVVSAFRKLFDQTDTLRDYESSTVIPYKW